MGPRIQYAKTADGVSIAFWTLGEGPPYVSTPGGPVSNIQREWQIPEIRAIFEMWAAGRKVVRFDRRGCGLSERDVAATPESSRAFLEVAERFDVTNRPTPFAQAPSTSKARADVWPP